MELANMGQELNQEWEAVSETSTKQELSCETKVLGYIRAQSAVY